MTTQVWQCKYCSLTYECEKCAMEHENYCPRKPGNQGGVVWVYIGRGKCPHDEFYISTLLTF
ncbi:hypothetical protein LCGC14_0434250 [marine sediment metagenome]|uniref:Uncharacterized protein n=1 Tax=marine sediment metagenome TaxID=412755 RepID=A0A0F9SM70_9ZZZZ